MRGAKAGVGSCSHLEAGSNDAILQKSCTVEAQKLETH